MQPPLLARCHLGVIYPNLGVIWTWVCVMHLATGQTNRGPGNEQQRVNPAGKPANVGPCR